MGKEKVGFYFYLTADSLTKVFQICSLSSPLQNTLYMNFVQTADLDRLPWQQKF